MRASRMNLVTLREDPSDAEISSHRLLMRAGFLHKSGAGLYLYGPLMQRVLNKVRAIVAEEMSAAGGLEITMPILQERELWERSGRWAGYQKSRTMLTVTDRAGQQFGLAPTAEEVVTDYAGHVVTSYKQLPVCYFQQHTKFRDEIRPRFGLMRVKEFIMMDAYSFHASQESLDETYRAMHDAYVRIFRRCGLEAFAVEADTGAIGGSDSHEFMIAAEVGEDTILLDAKHGYAANVERARAVIPAAKPWSGPTAQARVHTPAAGAIDQVLPVLQAAGYAIGADRLLKTLLFMADVDGKAVRVAAVVRGDRQVNAIQVGNAVARLRGGALLELRPMHPDEVRETTQAEPGFAGPGPGLSVDLCLADRQLQGLGLTVTGANATDYHLAGFDLERDAAVKICWEDIVLAQAGDISPKGGVMSERKGIEAGHIFKLGTKYSAAMGATYTDGQNKQQPMIMGCYGIGSSRVVAAAIEQYHDDKGMTWPMAIAPYHCVVVPAAKDDAGQQAAVDIYNQLIALGVEAVLDDRATSPGVKFKDWDLIGIPCRIVVGRSFAQGLVECASRNSGTAEKSPVDAVAWVQVQVSGR